MANPLPGLESIVRIPWVANPFRGVQFEEIWAPVAESALKFGSKGYAFLRSRDDRLLFTQFAAFESKMDFERYWYSEEVSEARVAASGMFQVPVLPVWESVVGLGSLELSPATT